MRWPTKLLTFRLFGLWLALGGVGVANLLAGTPAEELTIWSSGLAVLKTIKGTERNQALCCQKIGVALAAMGRYDEAIQYQKQALTIFVALPGMEALQRTCWGYIGDAEQGANRHAEAIAAYEKAGKAEAPAPVETVSAPVPEATDGVVAPVAEPPPPVAPVRVQAEAPPTAPVSEATGEVVTTVAEPVAPAAAAATTPPPVTEPTVLAAPVPVQVESPPAVPAPSAEPLPVPVPAAKEEPVAPAAEPAAAVAPVLSAPAAAGPESAAATVPATPIAGRNWIVPEVGMEFVWVPALKFWVSKYETTNGEYRQLAPDHDSRQYTGKSLTGNRQPVVYVSVEDANKFANWLTQREREAGRLPEGGCYRLPTRDEWTTAVECVDARLYPWGNDWPPTFGNYADHAARQAFPEKAAIEDYDDGSAVTCPVEQSGRNSLDLYGMGGNVWECTAADSGSGFVEWRGAAWDSDMNAGLRCGFRLITGFVNRANNCGFRLVLSR